MKTQDFIERANQIHNNKFDYSLVDYKNAKTKVTIICPIHGEFEQLPNDHLRGNGCRQCSGKGLKLTQEQFIQRADEIHNHQYDYSKVEYNKMDNKVIIICPIHGEFKITPRAVLHGHQGCKQCGVIKSSSEKRKTTEEFINEATTIHGGNYIYDKTIYINSYTKIIITCPKHGDFYQAPTNHIQGQGCPKCGNERLIINSGGRVKGVQPTPSPISKPSRTSKNIGKYNNDWFNQFPDNRLLPAQIYCVEFKHKTDHFLKIGITTQTIKQRFARTGLGDKAIDKKIIGVKYMSLYDAFTLEQQLLQELKQYQYFPNYVLDGYTECLKYHPVVIERLQQEFCL